MAKPTLAEQTQRNEKLRTISEYHPRLKDYVGLQKRARPSVYDMEGILGLTSNDAMAPRKTSRDGEAEPKSLIQDEKIDLRDFIRSQRLNYFASQSTSTVDERLENQNPNRLPGLTTKVGTMVTQSSSTAQGTAPLDAGTETASAVNPDRDQINTAVLPPTLIPQTSHIGPLSTCPADEDPSIMPIPSTQAFTFDARQLRDLNIIQSGGNGCARFGEEWNIEPEGEWGGGGWMGHAKSSEKEREGEVGAAEKWDGRGDEEGLLEELPCL